MCQIWRLLLWKSPKACQNVTIEFCFIMRIFHELRYTVIIEIVWIFYLKSVPAKFQKYSNHISWVISGTSSSKLSCNPRHPSRNISCNHRHHLLQPSWRRIFSTSNNQKTRVDSDINSDYKASSFDKLYIRRRNETQRALLGHTNGNIEMRSPSAAAMLTMVAAATIVRFPPVIYPTSILDLSPYVRVSEKVSAFIRTSRKNTCHSWHVPCRGAEIFAPLSAGWPDLLTRRVTGPAYVFENSISKSSDFEPVV